MAQTVQILRTTTVDSSPPTLLPGALSAELSASWTKLWVGAPGGNRLLLSSNPADTSLGGLPYLRLTGGTLTGALSGTSLTLSTPLTAASGGTGAATLTGVLVGNGTGPVTAQPTLGVANGGTGSATAPAALAALGAAPLASPSFTGNATIAGTLAVGGNVTAVLDITGGNYTGLHAPDNTGLIYIGAATGGLSTILYRNNHHQFQNVGGTINWGVFDTNGLAVVGGITATSNATFGGSLNVNATVLSYGPVATFTFEDRTLGSGSRWNWYASGGSARLNLGSDLLSVTNAGNLVLAGSLTVGGAAAATVAPFAGQFNAFYAPDGAGSNGAIILGVAANPTHKYSQTNHVFRDRADTTGFATFSSAGTANVSGAWTTLSDASLKEDIQPYKRGLEAVLALKPVQFRYVAGTPFASAEQSSRLLFGLLAGEVAPYVPEIVGTAEVEVRGESQTVDTLEPGNLVYALINAVQELAAKVAALEGAAR